MAPAGTETVAVYVSKSATLLVLQESLALPVFADLNLLLAHLDPEPGKVAVSDNVGRLHLTHIFILSAPYARSSTAPTTNENLEAHLISSSKADSGITISFDLEFKHAIPDAAVELVGSSLPTVGGVYQCHWFELLK